MWANRTRAPYIVSYHDAVYDVYHQIRQASVFVCAYTRIRREQNTRIRNAAYFTIINYFLSEAFNFFEYEFPCTFHACRSLVHLVVFVLATCTRRHVATRWNIKHVVCGALQSPWFTWKPAFFNITRYCRTWTTTKTNSSLGHCHLGLRNNEILSLYYISQTYEIHKW